MFHDVSIAPMVVGLPLGTTGACPMQATQGDLLQPAGVGTSARCRGVAGCNATWGKRLKIVG